MPDGRRPVLAVIGGGITGMSAAWAAVRKGAGGTSDPSVTVYEASDRLGGRIETVPFAGLPVDAGPDAFVTRLPSAEALCRELGLGDELLAPATSEASLFVGGSLHPFPAGLVLGVPTDLGALRRSGVISVSGRARIAADLLLPRRGLDFAGGHDPSVAEVIGRRLGRQTLDRLVDPVIGGINAGAADRLSLRSTAPQIASAVAGGGSIVRSLRALRRGRAADTTPAFLGLAHGLGSLVDRLAERLAATGAELRTGTAVTRISRAGTGFALEVGGAVEHADCVVLAVPAYAAGPLLADLAPRAATDLEAIAYAGVALVTFSWAASALPHRAAGGAASGPHRAGGKVLPGSGVLVPRGEHRMVTACTFTSSKWPHSTVPGRVLVRASAGRIDDERPFQLTDGELAARVREELSAILGITAPPLAVLLRRFPRSFPQYEPGHISRVERIRAHLSPHPAVAVAGAALDGIGIPACIAGGERAALAVLAAVPGA